MSNDTAFYVTTALSVRLLACETRSSRKDGNPYTIAVFLAGEGTPSPSTLNVFVPNEFLSSNRLGEVINCVFRFQVFSANLVSVVSGGQSSAPSLPRKGGV